MYVPVNMKMYLVTIASLILVWSLVGDSTSITSVNLDQEWLKFKDEYGRNYTNEAEELVRKAIFAEYLKRVNDETSRPRYEINKFSDWTDEERAQLLSPELATLSGYASAGDQDSYLLSLLNDEQARLVRNKNLSLIEAIDGQYGKPQKSFSWLNVSNVVGPASNQYNCRSCWAHATIGYMESQLVLRNITQKWTQLSTQSLVDCAIKGYHCKRGGGIGYAMNFIIKKGGVFTEESYPQTPNTVNECPLDSVPPTISVTSLKKHIVLKPSGHEILKRLLYLHGPIILLMDGKPLYITKGINHLTNDICKQTLKDEINHAVVLVGYTDKTWIIKNSWGEDWGLGGFFHVQMGSNACRVEEFPTMGTFV